MGTSSSIHIELDSQRPNVHRSQEASEEDSPYLVTVKQGGLFSTVEKVHCCPNAEAVRRLMVPWGKMTRGFNVSPTLTPQRYI